MLGASTCGVAGIHDDPPLSSLKAVSSATEPGRGSAIAKRGNLDSVGDRVGQCCGTRTDFQTLRRRADGVERFKSASLVFELKDAWTGEWTLEGNARPGLAKIRRACVVDGVMVAHHYQVEPDPLTRSP